jgi:hypothetical protein
MKVVNYFSLDIFQRLQQWRTSEDVNDSSVSGSRPWRKAAEKVSPNARPVVSAWHTKMVAQTSHDTPTATRQPRTLSPDYQRRGLRQTDLPSREPQTARLLLVRHPDFGTARDRCADKARIRNSIFELPFKGSASWLPTWRRTSKRSAFRSWTTGTSLTRLSCRPRRYGYSWTFWPSSPRATPSGLCPCMPN